MKLISVIDTSICDYNLGNQIIMESVFKYINNIFPQSFILRMQHLDAYGSHSMHFLSRSNYVFYGGTNCLSSNIFAHNQTGFSFFDSFKFRRLVLCGVGWWQYQKKPDFFSAIFLKNLLDPVHIHSVRDSYTVKQLHSIGITNVLNTSCPSTWSISKEHCDQIKELPSDSVVFTLTDYSQSPAHDIELIHSLKLHYQNLYFWPQGLNDISYLFELLAYDDYDIKILNPRLEDFDSLLLNQNIDYIGTRLHAGIRALQHKKRSLIVSIDNRATELASDISLPVINRARLHHLSHLLETRISFAGISIPHKNIDEWLSQFA